MPKFANQKVWVAIDGTTLVPDGDEMAAVLLANKGMPLSDEKLAGFENADEFFDDPGKPKKENPLKKDDDDLDHHKKQKK